MKTLAFLSLLVAAGVWAADPDQNASLEGFITAPGQVCLQGVSVTVDSNTRPVHFETKTDQNGFYRIADVPPGSYTVCADARSEGCILVPRLVLNYGEHARRDFHFSKALKKSVCDPPASPLSPK